MSRKQLFRLAFEEGCGRSFKSVIKSRKFRKMVHRELSVFDRHSEDSGEGQRLRHSPFATTIFATSMFWGDQIESDEIAYHPFLLSKQDLVDRAMLRLLGDELVRTAKKLLPDEAISYAKQYARCKDESAKVEILTKFYDLLRLINTRIEPTVIELEPKVFEWADGRFEPYDCGRFLPKQYGKYGSTRTVPLCLGMAILLIAWARIAKANVMLASTISFNSMDYWEADAKVSQILLDDVRKRNIPMDDQVISSYEKNIAIGKEFRSYAPDFHQSMAIELAPGCWIHFDPYLGHFDVMPADFNMNALFTAQTKIFDDIIPGMTIVSQDQGRQKRFCRKLKYIARKAVQKSRDLSQYLAGGELTGDDIRKMISSGKQLSYLRRKIKVCFQGGNVSLAIAKMMFGYRPTQPVKREEMKNHWQRLNHDAGYRQQCVDRLPGLFHFFAKICYYMEHDARKDSPENFPADIEFSNPEFSLALHVMNNLHCWSKYHLDSPIFLVKHSTSQSFWHEAAVSFRDRKLSKEEYEIMRMATPLIKFLNPHLHPQCKVKLGMLDRYPEIQRRNPDGKENVETGSTGGVAAPS